MRGNENTLIVASFFDMRPVENSGPGKFDARIDGRNARESRDAISQASMLRAAFYLKPEFHSSTD
jgi:hypothetical protein